jgi:hypothetical protein
MEEHKHMDRSFQSNADSDWDEVALTSKQRREREIDKAIEKDWLDEKLDEALEETFPGSDPVSIAQPPQSPYEKKP